MYLSSSATISRGVMSSRAGRNSSPSGTAPLAPPGIMMRSLSDLLAIRNLQFRAALPQFFHGEIRICVDANLTGDAHCFERQIFAAQFGVFHHCAGGGKRVTPARTDGDDAVVRFDHVAIARENEG